MQAAVNFDLRYVGNEVAGFGDGRTVDADFAGKDHGLSLFAGDGEAARDQKLVEAHFAGGRHGWQQSLDCHPG